MSPAHNKIFGAKFLSFERLKTTCSHTACYTVFGRSVMKSDVSVSAMQPFFNHYACYLCSNIIKTSKLC